MASLIRECKKLLLTGYGGYDKMKVVVEEAPTIKSDEVRVLGLLAASLNLFRTIVTHTCW